MPSQLDNWREPLPIALHCVAHRADPWQSNVHNGLQNTVLIAFATNSHCAIPGEFRKNSLQKWPRGFYMDIILCLLIVNFVMFANDQADEERTHLAVRRTNPERKE